MSQKIWHILCLLLLKENRSSDCFSGGVLLFQEHNINSRVLRRLRIRVELTQIRIQTWNKNRTIKKRILIFLLEKKFQYKSQYSCDISLLTLEQKILQEKV